MSRVLLALLAVPSIGANPARPGAASESPADGAAQAAVISVLSAETESRQPLDRRALLQDVLEQSPDAAPVRWQAGYVRTADEWRPFEGTVAAIEDDALRDAYYARRKITGQNAGDQVRLANWCKANGLPEQERAHLTAALAFAGGRDLPHVRARLGHHLVNSRWMTPEQIATTEQTSREMAESLASWGRKMQGIAEGLAGNRRQRESAEEDLRAITNPGALPAVEAVLAPAHEFAALRAVEWLANVDRYQSSVALARQAVFSNWASVRKASIHALKARRWEDFVPSLMNALHGPTEYSFQILIGFRGELFYTRVATREMFDQLQVSRYGRADFSTMTRGWDGLFSAPPGQVRRANRWRNDALRRIQDDCHWRVRALAVDDEEGLNRRVAKILAELTGEEPATDVATWWSWWTNYLDVAPREKQVVIVAEEAWVIPRPRDFNALSCLSAETPVWTDRGPVSVVQIRIGDRVLAKDIGTGELAYKPVVLTTAREAPQLVRLTVGKEHLELTGGHPVWVSGSGWTKTRDITSGQPLHTVTGTVSADSLEPLGAGTVYNLVVADFHTYFFGDAMILSHDTTISKLTNVVVPGLPPEHSHAE